MQFRSKQNTSVHGWIVALLLFLPVPSCSTDDASADDSQNESDTETDSGENDTANGIDTNGGDTPGGDPDLTLPDTTLNDDVAQIGGCQMFPADNWWNTDISEYPVHENSNNFIDNIGRDTNMHPDFGTMWEGEPIGIPYTIVDGTEGAVSVTFDYEDESDPGPYPIPADPPVEGGSDRHILIVETQNCALYELFAVSQNGDQSWNAGSGAIFDLSSNDLRPDRWTSADAAGLPILPGLVRYEEVVGQGEINHALRFTVSTSQRAYVTPATHAASSNTDPNTPPMGLRFRMRQNYDCSSYSSEVQVICQALKTFGMFMADNGSNWYLSGAPNPSWSDDNLRDLRQITGDAFEVVYTGEIIQY